MKQADRSRRMDNLKDQIRDLGKAARLYHAEAEKYGEQLAAGGNDPVMLSKMERIWIAGRAGVDLGDG